MKGFWTWLINQDDDVLKAFAWAFLAPVFVIWLVWLGRSAAQGHYLTAVALLFLPAAGLCGLAYAGYRLEKRRSRNDG
ncbi:MAG: hypothetical protein F9K41_00015 [Sphingopyxis terrae]|nr:MAG: hypothetical protein F9K41_00015 [Sphingopyxis terrae]